MIPLWVKARNGKYHRFPYEALQTLADGRKGLQLPLDHNYHTETNVFLKLCEDTSWDLNHFFDYSVNLDAYVLKVKP